MKKTELPLIAHMHIFKCAGTTFSGILERCFNGEVLYVESKQANQRLSWKKVISSNLLDDSPKALTSHLIDLPEHRSLAGITVSIVRNPIDRLYSAFLFARDKQGRFSVSTTFRDYIEHHRYSIVANFMTRHLSPQSWDASFKARNGWELRPELIDLDRDDLFVGCVERFDESMVLLEYQLEQSGFRLDLAYPGRMNARRRDNPAEAKQNPYQDSCAWLEPAIEIDRILVERVNNVLDGKIQRCSDFAGRLESYRQRCISLSENKAIAFSFQVKAPHEWSYLE